MVLITDMDAVESMCMGHNVLQLNILCGIIFSMLRLRHLNRLNNYKLEDTLAVEFQTLLTVELQPQSTLRRLRYFLFGIIRT